MGITSSEATVLPNHPTNEGLGFCSGFAPFVSHHLCELVAESQRYPVQSLLAERRWRRLFRERRVSE